MDFLVHLITAYGIWVVFASVLVDQVGIPLPAYPLVVVAAGLATEHHEGVWPILAAAIVASMLADSLWFVGGRFLGTRLVRGICRLSLSPDSCVLSTRRAYTRWGPASLLVAKFVPGFAAVATALAGETRVPARSFLLFDGLGALLWAGVAVALGVLFHDAVEDVLAALDSLGHYAVPVLLGLLAAFVFWKWLRRWSLLRQLRMTRITAPEVNRFLEEGNELLILDVRPEALRAQTGWLPRAVFDDGVDRAPPPPHVPVVVYCDCPNELSAALIARELGKRGFRDVRPLAGGFHGWQASGFPVERPAMV
jgi:membrane protein DedA with SNARE-associated domain/rhodanese-related sulfurtransferase